MKSYLRYYFSPSWLILLVAVFSSSALLFAEHLPDECRGLDLDDGEEAAEDPHHPLLEALVDVEVDVLRLLEQLEKVLPTLCETGGEELREETLDGAEHE